VGARLHVVNLATRVFHLLERAGLTRLVSYRMSGAANARAVTQAAHGTGTADVRTPESGPPGPVAAGRAARVDAAPAAAPGEDAAARRRGTRHPWHAR
jgi:hypothetical protein